MATKKLTLTTVSQDPGHQQVTVDRGTEFVAVEPRGDDVCIVGIAPVVSNPQQEDRVVSVGSTGDTIDEPTWKRIGACTASGGDVKFVHWTTA